MEQHETKNKRILRIFLSTPGDVAEERSVVRALIKDFDPFVQDKVAIDLISWDDPHAPAAMPARLTPQQAIDLGQPPPSECDIVLVIFWSRMGTPLPNQFTKPNGQPYRSSSEWEYQNAVRAFKEKGRPIVLVYRRAATPMIKISDPDLDAKRAQYRQVEEFFLGIEADKQMYRTYEDPSEFRELVRSDLIKIVRELAQRATEPTRNKDFRIFLNYRREDASAWARLVHKALQEKFGAERVSWM